MRLRNGLAALLILAASASARQDAAAAAAQTAGVSASAALAQGVASPPSSGIADCDEYYAMVSACLPRMCETERTVVELELSLSREVLSRVMALKRA